MTENMKPNYEELIKKVRKLCYSLLDNFGYDEELIDDVYDILEFIDDRELTTQK